MFFFFIMQWAVNLNFLCMVGFINPSVAQPPSFKDDFVIIDIVLNTLINFLTLGIMRVCLFIIWNIPIRYRRDYLRIALVGSPYGAALSRQVETSEDPFFVCLFRYIFEVQKNR